jgi:two-component system C4-dicarboxylate transport response regulator DctD
MRESGTEALNLVTAHAYATIISDVRMPGMTGWQFLRAVRQRCADTPVFLISGNAGPPAKKAVLGAGATSFFANRSIETSSWR